MVRDSRRPVSYELLLSLGDGLAGVFSSGYEIRLFRAAFPLTFFGAFRISELVSPSRCRAGGLLEADVKASGEDLACVIRRSKCAPMCSVVTVHNFLRTRPLGHSPLLIHGDGLFLSMFQFIQVFRKVLTHLGLEVKDFNSHSFRIGTATEAAQRGLHPDTVKQIRRWESDKYRLYVRSHLL